MKLPRLLPLLLACVMLIIAWPTLASLSTVTGLFQAGQYDDARESLNAADEGVRPGEDILWRSRLTTNPDEALTLLNGSLTDKRLPPAVRIRMALEVADINAGRGDHRGVLDALLPLINDAETDLPGVVHLRAGLAMRGRGQLQQAREMLASVRPADPAFVLARYYLGDIGLEQKDTSLALRYFESAVKATDQAGANRLAGGMWRAYMTAGEDREAADLLDKLSAEDPGSLALLEIRRLVQVNSDERQARAAVAPADSVVTSVVDNTGRYALQLGAFSDRGLALEFVKRYTEQLPDLHIDKLRDQRGQFLYKVRTGDYVNPALARSEAKQLQRRLGIDVMMTDLSADNRN